MNKAKSKNIKSRQKTYTETVCPFCSLLCDDITIKNNNSKLMVSGTTCQQSINGFTKTDTNQDCLIQGSKASYEDAIQAAAGILKKSKRPLLSGMGTDVDGTRAAMILAETTRAYVDHMASVGALRNYRVLQEKGYILTTLAEVKNRADLIIMAGTDAVSDGFPRFFERYVWNQHSLFGLDTSNREIIFIGEKLKTKHGVSPNGNKPIHIKCQQSQIGEVFGLINALMAGHQFSQKRINGINLSQLTTVISKIQSANYGVVVWSPPALGFPHAELTVQSICEFVRDRNPDNRFAGLSLGGNDGGMSAANVCAWQSGYPLRVSYQKGYPEFDPNAFGTNELIENKEVDAMMWISAFGAEIAAPKSKLPQIVLADKRSAIAGKPDVYIPVGTTGLDHGGQMIRTDNVVSMTLSAVRQSDLPSVHDVIMDLNKLVQ